MIGAGPTGEDVAARAVRGGPTPAIVVAELVGPGADEMIHAVAIAIIGAVPLNSPLPQAMPAYPTTRKLWLPEGYGL